MIFMPTDERHLTHDLTLYRNESENGDAVFHLFPQLSPDGTEAKYTHLGHATSPDLIHWTEHAAIRVSGQPGEWDGSDHTHAHTGDVVELGDTYHYFYGSEDTKARSEGGVTKIGLMTSRDLFHWRKWPRNPVLAPDPRYYEDVTDPTQGHVGGIMDSCLHYDETEGVYFHFFYARVRGGPVHGRSCLGVAKSRDLGTSRILIIPRT